MQERIVGFVMSGGVGSRLWPLSREDNPKQFHDLAGPGNGGSMLSRTVRRLNARAEGETPVFVIAAERHTERVLADLASLDLGGGGAIFEPVGRNTAAAVAVATLETLERWGDALVLVVPSDHEISTDAQFWSTVERGVAPARSGSLVVFGVPPTHPETGYGYVEVEAGDAAAAVRDVRRFVEKPDLATAKAYVADGNFFWNAGIFLFKASVMRDAFLEHAPAIFQQSEQAWKEATRSVAGVFLPLDSYSAVASISIDYAIMERAAGISMVPTAFRWNDLGSWQSLLDASASDDNGNVVVGDVVAIDTERSYLRSQGRLLSVFGMKDVAIVATLDAVFVAPVGESQNVKKIVERLEKTGRLETRFTPAPGHVLAPGAMRRRVEHWLFDEALPLWSKAGVDREGGGFFEALTFTSAPVLRPKRMRTIARQVYAFAVAKEFGWQGEADDLIAHGIAFMRRGRTPEGGWARSLTLDGAVLDGGEDAYDHSCVLLALAHAHRAGNPEALQLGEETFDFLDRHLEDQRMTGFLESANGEGRRRSNPHMHLLEAFLAWHAVTGERQYLRRAARIVDLFRSHFFDPETWTLGEFFEKDWSRAPGREGEWTEPGHHFEWCSLLVDFSVASGQQDLLRFARKLYASAVASGLNRATGLAYGAVSREGVPLDRLSRSWPQTEVIKAALALDGRNGLDLGPEVEARVNRLFQWHLDPAPNGLWIDGIDEVGRASANDVPASILYHLVYALTMYLGRSREAV